MLTFTFECENEAQLAALQQAAHFLAEMHRLAQTAPAGQVLSAVEGQALEAGRQLLRDSLQSAAQQRIDRDEKKGASLASARAATPAAPRAGTAVNS
jgi:hypothetical protein